MEQWEIKLRERLNRELTDGSYELGEGSIKGYTGKGGYIEYQVALYKALKESTLALGTELLKDIEEGKDSYSTEEYNNTYKHVEKMLSDLTYKKDE